MAEKVKKYYCLSEEQLKSLIKASNDLAALESGGVDNWSYYGDALDEYYTEYTKQLGFSTDNKEIEELADIIAEEELKTEYQQISDWKMP